jgi:Holliday junction resolvase RusA-like endonuclease
MEYSGTIYGKLASKANSRRITRSGIVIKSQPALEFTKGAVLQLHAIKKGRKAFTGDVGLEATVFYPSKRNDLDVQLFMDCLEKAHLIENDRQIRECSARKEWDKDNPRVEFVLYELD